MELTSGELKRTKPGWQSLMWVACFALAQTGTMYCQKRVSLVMGAYPYVMSVAQPTCTTIRFGVMYILSSLAKGRRTRGPDASFTALPLFAMVGASLSLANVLMFFGLRGDLVAGPLAVLLLQFVVLFTMGFSIWLLGHRYGAMHVAGAVVVVLGIAIKSGVALTHDTAHSALWAAVLVVLAMVPQALGHVQVEKSLKALSQDMWWMWAWVNVTEIPLAMICVPLQLWVLNQSTSNIGDGFNCLLSLEACPQSDGALEWWVAFISCLVMNRMFAALVISSGSATFLFLGATAAIPMVTALYGFAPLPGMHSVLGAPDVTALLLVIVGLMMFHMAPKLAIEDGYASDGTDCSTTPLTLRTSPRQQIVGQ